MGIHVNVPANKPGGHACDFNTDFSGYGPALDACGEDINGHFWAGNDEYVSMVAFCPHCGAKAPTPPTNTPRTPR